MTKQPEKSTAPHMVSEHARYTGRVQGVGFRATTQAFASTLAIVGWVRNEPDGSVAMHTQGSAQAIETLHEQLRDRFGAQRTTCSRTAAAFMSDATAFVIRR